MKFASIQRLLGLLAGWSSLMMLPPALIGWWYQDGTDSLFLISAACLVGIGAVVYFPARSATRELRLRDGFLAVVAGWLTLALVGTVPFLLLAVPRIGFVDALFESMSGLTTTGATILNGLDALPRGLLYYRQQLQWLGGLGIIVLAVAILPILRVGGMQLYRAEMPSPLKDTKLSPRIAEAAKSLWMIYLSITVMCALSYWLAGMQLFDAIGHSFSTVAIGGFSTHDASFAWWDSPTIEIVAMIFMIISGMNFALHFTAWRRASAQPYFQDTELKVYMALLIVAAALASLALFADGTFATLPESMRYASFQAISMLTTAGFTTTDFHLWPGFVPVMLISLAFVGGCAGSTAGGMKVIRAILLYRLSVREIRRLVHPHAIVNVKYGGHNAAPQVLDAVLGFFFLFMGSTATLSVLVNATGPDILTSFSAVAACITNLGPGLGDVGFSYAALTPWAKSFLIFAMLAGRLEIYTVLVLLTPVFWRD